MIGRAGLAAALCALALAPAAGADELVTIDTPPGPVTAPTQANVLLPDGYDPAKAYPLLLLLHGVGDAPNFPSWSRQDSGRVREVAAGLQAIVVMPEGGRGFYTDHFNGGRRGDPSWETYYLDTLMPFIERRYRILPGRSNRAIAGNSMGGFGAAYLGGQRPDLFGTVASFSGFLQHQRPEVDAGLRLVGEVEYTTIFGPMDGAYATGHNPTRTPANFRASRVFSTVGDGTADPAEESSPVAVAGGGASELELRQHGDEFAAALAGAGVDHTYRPKVGVHDWPYWRAALRDAIAFGLFRPVVEQPRAWSLSTVRTRGRAWGFDYAFTSAPEAVVTFEHRPGRLVALGGEGATVTVTDRATGCRTTEVVPSSELLPPTTCGRLRLTVTPRRLPRGRRTAVRVRVVSVGADGRRAVQPGAVVRLGRERALTDAAGVARLVLRATGRPGRRLVRATAPGRTRAVAPVLVVRPR